MIYYHAVFVFLLGLAFGSFLNVVIDRLPKDQPLLISRSHCDFCKKPLGALDLIPLLSFIILRGKCRHCHKKISFYYPIVELITAVLFLINFLTIKNYYALIFSLIVTSSLIALFFIDIKYGLLPDKVIYPGVLFVILYSPLIRNQKSFLEDILVAAAIALFFLSIIVITRGKGMGGGDVKFAFLIGIILGWQKAILAIFLSFIIGGAAGVLLIILKKKKFGQTIPFGPFLSLSTYISLMFGNDLVKFYLAKVLGLPTN